MEGIITHRTLLTFILPALILVSLPGLAWASSFSSFKKCKAAYAQETLAQAERLEKRYKEISRDNYRILENNRPYFLEAQGGGTQRTRRLAILIHGFMGSPDEMRQLAKGLQQRGFFVYGALIPGFGATAAVANHFKAEQWTRWMSQEVRRAQECFHEIHMTGFSTGGLLINDYMSKNPGAEKIASLSFVSPFFEVESLFNSVIQDGTASVIDEISVETLYKVFRFPDVQVMLEEPDSYLQHVPLKNTKEIVRLGAANKKRLLTTPLAIPTFLVIAEDDKVADPRRALQVISANFKDPEVRHYPEKYRNRRVPHHILAESVSPVAAQARELIINHIVGSRFTE